MIYTQAASEAAFLLGGIGTGNVSIGARGQFKDWELFNRPGKGNRLPHTYASIWVKPYDGKPVARVLEARVPPPYRDHSGIPAEQGGGLPRFARSEMSSVYPFVNLQWDDDAVPVSVSLEAFTPFIPLNSVDSAIPGVYLTYRVSNPSKAPVEVTIAFSMTNPCGVTFSESGNPNFGACQGNVNEVRHSNGLKGIQFRSEAIGSSEAAFGDVTLAVPEAIATTAKPVWHRGRWFDAVQHFWDDFAADGLLEDNGHSGAAPTGASDTATLGIRITVAPGETADFPFLLAWRFPNRINGWNDWIRVQQPGKETIQNHYALQFADAWDVAAYLLRERERLESVSRAFSNALYGGTLPTALVEAAANAITVLRSPTCFRLEDGRFLGYEGVFDQAGSCEGNCTHVWNYSQTVAYLFPELEMSMRRTEFLEESDPAGKMNFRAYRLFEHEWDWYGTPNPPAAADGQLGSIMRVYREWSVTGDHEFLSELWPCVRRSLEYALRQWDRDGDLLLEEEHHTTYDIEFIGPNPLSAFMLLGALKACILMARKMNDGESAERYLAWFDKSAEQVELRLWNGEYFCQELEDQDARTYQFGTGCLSDQLLGQALSETYGLGKLVSHEKVQSALQAVYRYNFRDDFGETANCQRSFVQHGERGLSICTWPRGGRPAFPFVYSHEVWTGIEFQVAAHLIREGEWEKALRIIEAVQDRHDGIKRNPWSHAETGHHYVRSMASWGLLLAASGYQCQLQESAISFNPALYEHGEFSSFWSCGRAWGIYWERLENGVRIPNVEVLYGNADGIAVTACGQEWRIEEGKLMKDLAGGAVAR